jgi:hypothetical protein
MVAIPDARSARLPYTFFLMGFPPPAGAQQTRGFAGFLSDVSRGPAGAPDRPRAAEADRPPPGAYWFAIKDVQLLLLHFCRCAPHCFLAYLASHFSHPAQRCIRPELRNGLWKISVERVAALLLNLSRFRGILIAVSTI